MHEQDSFAPTAPLRMRLLGLLGGHGPGGFRKPGGLGGGKAGPHGGHSKLAGLLGGLLGGGGKGKGTPQQSPPPSPGDGGGGGESGGKPAPPGPIPPPPTSSRDGGPDATSTVTDHGAANAGSVPSIKPGSPSASALPESATSTPRTSPTLMSLSTSQPYSGAPSLPLSASAPPAQSPTVAPGGSTAAPSTGTSNNQPNSSGRGQKGFPLAAAGVLGAVLSFLVVSGIIWGLWYFLRARRRRRAHRASLLEWDFDVPKTAASSRFAAGSGTLSTSTIPYFISVEEAGRRDVVKRKSDSSFEHAQASAAIPNPFAHSSDEGEAGPFDAADTSSGTLQRGNTQMTRFTMSV